MLNLIQGLTFDDVLLIPQYSDINSRFGGEIDLSTKVAGIDLKFPVISANMNTVTEVSMCNTMYSFGGLGIIHRYLKPEDHLYMIDKISGPKVLSIGASDEEFYGRLIWIVKHLKDQKLSAVLIDVAHAHHYLVVSQIEKIKKHIPNLQIIVGNISTRQAATDLFDVGADCIKVGIGGGCLSGDTRILMANGTYKNIKDIKVHERVINKNGKSVEVIGVKFSGYKSVYKYRNNYFYKDTLVTSDHLHFAGDYSSTPNCLEDYSLSKVLDKKTKRDQSKFVWSSIKNFQNKTCLLPRYIKFELKESFEINLSDYAYANRTWKGLINYKNIYPSYDLGYIIGTFLGDGTSQIHKLKRLLKDGKESRNTCGMTSWSFGLQEDFLVKKLTESLNRVFGDFSNTQVKKTKNMLVVYNKSNIVARFFLEFGKRKEKHLPEKYYCSNQDYIKGILDGLVDSDGSCPEKGGKDYRISFTNTSPFLIELYSVFHYIIYGYFPSISVKKPTIGNLKNIKIENCSESFMARNVKLPENILTKDFQICKIYTDIVDTNLLIPTYDIEVDCESHSFIANNAIVHNSVCSTRLKTGCGVPQLTALLECVTVRDELFPNKTIIADGGIRSPGDIVKALAVGVDAVMVGKLLAGSSDTPGEVLMRNEVEGSQSTFFTSYKIYQGMASRKAQEGWRGKARSVEGKSMEVEYKGPTIDILEDTKAGMLSGFSYCGARNLKELRKNAKFIQQTLAGQVESRPHGVY